MSDGAARIRRLPEMLEGQVAVLSSGQLGAQESLAMLGGLRASALYRADQHSYTLYPDKDLAGFLDRNTFPAGRAESCPLVAALVAVGDRSLVVADVHGDLHFAAGIRNVRDVQEVLDGLAANPELGEVAHASRAELLDIFEEVFTHAEFTGRSGSFFAYEGLGSIYWHMVSKLLLAVQETIERAVADGESSATVQALIEAYEDVRAGLGYRKSAEVYGAFPTDPYSHTPGGHGARQPGMTGQVKEEVLTRLGELGLRVEDGRIVFRPIQLRATEWRESPGIFEYIDVLGYDATVDLPAGSLAFTFCQVPVVYRKSDALMVRVVRTDGTAVECHDGVVPAELSASVFCRTGAVDLIEVRTPDRPLKPPAPPDPDLATWRRRAEFGMDLRDQLRGEPVGRQPGVERSESPFDGVAEALPRGQGHEGTLVLQLDVVALCVEVHLDLGLARGRLVECQVGEDPQEEGRMVRMGQPSTGVGEELRRRLHRGHHDARVVAVDLQPLEGRGRFGVQEPAAGILRLLLQPVGVAEGPAG